MAVIIKFDFNVKTSTKKIFVAICLVPNCSWKIGTVIISASSSEFKVTKFIEVHSCSTVHRYTRQGQTNVKCIGTMYVDGFSGGRDLKGITPRDIMNTMQSVYGLDIGYTKAHGALVYARDLVRGTPLKGYQDLPAYLYKIELANPGTITKLVRDDNERFKYFFIALGACIKGFEFLRRVVVVDGTHLTGKYRGTMLVATGQDADSGIFPIAFGIVDIENDAAWEWFFTQLRGVLHDNKILAIIYDRHPSIATGIEKVFLAANRGICYYHLKTNIITRLKKDPIISLVYSAAYAYRLVDFERLFNMIRCQNSILADYLEEADFRLWACAHFPRDRFRIMTSNFAESINGALKQKKGFSIASFVDTIRKLLSRWFVERREKAASLETKA